MILKKQHQAFTKRLKNPVPKVKRWTMQIINHLGLINFYKKTNNNKTIDKVKPNSRLIYRLISYISSIFN